MPRERHDHDPGAGDALRRLPGAGAAGAGARSGVTGAAVNLLLNSATVQFDPAVTTPERIVEAVRSTGYDAELPTGAPSHAEDEEERSRAAAAEFRDLATKSLTSLVVGVGVMVLMPPAPVQFALATLVMLWAEGISTSGHGGPSGTTAPT